MNLILKLHHRHLVDALNEAKRLEQGHGASHLGRAGTWFLVWIFLFAVIPYLLIRLLASFAGAIGINISGLPVIVAALGGVSALLIVGVDFGRIIHASNMPNCKRTNMLKRIQEETKKRLEGCQGYD